MRLRRQSSTNSNLIHDVQRKGGGLKMKHNHNTYLDQFTSAAWSVDILNFKNIKSQRPYRPTPYTSQLRAH